MSHVQKYFCSLLHQLCNEIITVWSLSLMMVFIGSGSGKGWLDGKPLPDEDHYPWFHIWHKSKMSWKGLIGVQILSYILFINEIVAVRHMCCSWSTTQKVECNSSGTWCDCPLHRAFHSSDMEISDIHKYVFVFFTNDYRFVCTCQYDIVVKHNASMKHWWDLSNL